jgi:hypothetical protein
MDFLRIHAATQIAAKKLKPMTTMMPIDPNSGDELTAGAKLKSANPVGKQTATKAIPEAIVVRNPIPKLDIINGAIEIAIVLATDSILRRWMLRSCISERATAKTTVKIMSNPSGGTK